MKLDVVIVGAGGIGAPLLLGLSERTLAVAVVDDDIVEKSNLHRQILFGPGDVGRPKLDALSDALRDRCPRLTLSPRPGRVRPDRVMELVADAKVIVDATDNFPTRFLLADAAFLLGVPIVHAASVMWQATCLAVPASGAPCYRCLFEAPPEGGGPDCATAGVVGPVCGVAGALAAEATLRILDGVGDYGAIWTFDGRRDRLRRVGLSPRPSCPLCGTLRAVRSIEPSRYTTGGISCFT